MSGGPSRVLPLGRCAANVKKEYSYEQDLVRLLDQLTLEERDEFQTSLKQRISAGGLLSDYDVAMNDLIQQARELTVLNQDRMLAESIALEEDSDVSVDQTPTVPELPPQPKGKRTRKKRKKKNRQHKEVDRNPMQISQVLSQPTNRRPESERISNQTPPKSALVRDPPNFKGKEPERKGREFLWGSAWAKGPPPSDTKGKEKQRNGNSQSIVQVARSGPSPLLWKTGETLLFSKENFAFGSLASLEHVPKTSMVKQATGHDCVACQDSIYGAEIRAPCGHYYDIVCIADLFKSATRDETLFPPRCCKKNIPFTQVQRHLPQTLVATFKEKGIEFGTLKRVYCSSPTCSRFLGPLSEGDSPNRAYTCTGCFTKTCSMCREQDSNDRTHVCRPDADATEVLDLSRASGWARCPGCLQMIELNIGCFHMTCRCRTEFCYLCQARWKSCQCVQWDERLLLAAAEGRVDAQLGVGRELRDAPAQRAPLGPPAARNPFAVLDRQQANPAPGPIAVRPVNTAPTSAIPTRTRTDTITSTSASTSTSGETDWSELVPNIAMRERLVLEMMERLRIDHDCDHIHWRYQDDGGHCDNCGDYLPLYLFRCQDCDMLACSRCVRNRL